MIVDYYFIRKQTLIVGDLYSYKGIYNYGNGFNAAALWALVLGILPNVPGFLTTIKVIGADIVPDWISHVYNYAWFVGFGVSGFVYWLLMRRRMARG